MSSQSGPGHGRAEPGLSAIMSERRRLINLAYRLLGSLAEAEDAVQETYARWYAMTPQQQEAIENPRAWLSKVASRICLNLLGSARALNGTTPPASGRATRPSAASHLSACPMAGSSHHATGPPRRHGRSAGASRRPAKSHELSDACSPSPAQRWQTRKAREHAMWIGLPGARRVV